MYKSFGDDFGSIAEGLSLAIRADDDSTILETDVDDMHQAVQRLID